MKLLEILTPESPRWETFVEQLDAAIAEHGCASGTNKDNAVDLESSLDYFEDHGGYCDCEIILNVDKGWPSHLYIEGRRKGNLNDR
jgi:Protein of unknown function (DUF2695)